MPTPPVLPPSWLQVLEKIEASLAEMVRDSERESPPPEPQADRDAAWREALARLDDRLAALDDCAGRADRAAAEADAVLADAADGLKRHAQAAFRWQQRQMEGNKGVGG
jgi:hypothetical protein